jgi:hypothetical protein
LFAALSLAVPQKLEFTAAVSNSISLLPTAECSRSVSLIVISTPAATSSSASSAAASSSTSL